MRVLFLDFDGVLNSKRWWDERPSKEQIADEFIYQNVGFASEQWVWALRSVDPAAVACVNAIVERSDARVCVSSSWRHMFALPKLEHLLRVRGFKHHLIGATPDAMYVRERGEKRVERGEEIARWMELMNVQPDDIAILDDDGDMAHLCDRLFQTQFDEGLRDYHVDGVVGMFR